MTSSTRFWCRKRAITQSGLTLPEYMAGVQTGAVATQSCQPSLLQLSFRLLSPEVPEYRAAMGGRDLKEAENWKT